MLLSRIAFDYVKEMSLKYFFNKSGMSVKFSDKDLVAAKCLESREWIKQNAYRSGLVSLAAFAGKMG